MTMRHYTIRRLRRGCAATRRRAQGVALTEALIAISVIIILFAGVWFFHDLHEAKADTMRVARFRAWQATRPGCDGRLTGRDTLEVSVQEPLRVIREQNGEIRPFERVTLTSAIEMSCNEEPRPESDIFVILERELGTGIGQLVQPIGQLIIGIATGGGL